MPAPPCPGTVPAGTSCRLTSQRRRCCRSRLRSCPTPQRGLCLRSTFLGCMAWLLSGLWRGRSCLRDTAMLLASQGADRNCLRDRRCSLGKLRCRRSRSRLSSRR
jgi:hypothetical protein